MDTSLRLLTLPVLSIVEELFPDTKVRVFGDNQSMLTVLKKGKNPTMRHVSRTHRVSIAWLHEQYHRNKFGFVYVRSEDMSADMLTKSTPSPHKWNPARRVINIFDSFDELIDQLRASDSFHVSSAACAVHSSPVTSCLYNKHRNTLLTT